MLNVDEVLAEAKAQLSRLRDRKHVDFLREWTERHGEAFVELGRDELTAIVDHLREGNTFEAQLVLAQSMTPSEFSDFQDKTTAKLEGVAKHRHEVRAKAKAALEELGRHLLQAAAEILAAIVKGAI